MTNTEKQYVFLYSSGTSKNIRKKYKFSSLETIKNLENIVKYNNNDLDNIKIISGDTKTVGGYSKTILQPVGYCPLSNNKKRIFNLTYNIKNKSELINILKTLDRPIKIEALPNEIMTLTQDQECLNTLIEMGKKNIIKVINTTGWLSFYKKNELKNHIHINDNMFNWVSGLNFFTCQYHQKHFLDTFVITNKGIKNKYNEAAIYYCNNDYFKIKDDKEYECECGLKYKIFEFYPSYEYTRFSIGEWEHLIEKLSSLYINLQFIKKNSEEIDCLYFCQNNNQISEHDMEIIKKYFKNYKINFLNEMFCLTGFAKYAPFWDNTLGNPKEYYNKNNFKLKPYPVEVLNEFILI